ncbi:flagellar biosynthetic protein FliQ [candidate division GN15 bacterium]|jgi:flagellar biosynthetic protein FliQ|uniref:Flagellar biosynthetic protein FliQ n=1 Tax=candidate division GN15 bacterium TaxID=2072418 RepID=A0A855X2Q7_9BACT|nr:MAG: flagellar biosynthetic protein FliQ [candidate division GN15 bacterium]
MTPQTVIAIAREALTVTLLVASPMLIFGLVIGLIISIFQAVTQINEMTLTIVPKIVAVAVSLLIFLPWMINLLIDFTRHMFAMIPTLGG